MHLRRFRERLHQSRRHLIRRLSQVQVRGRDTGGRQAARRRQRLRRAEQRDPLLQIPKPKEVSDRRRLRRREAIIGNRRTNRVRAEAKRQVLFQLACSRCHPEEFCVQCQTMGAMFYSGDWNRASLPPYGPRYVVGPLLQIPNPKEVSDRRLRRREARRSSEIEERIAIAFVLELKDKYLFNWLVAATQRSFVFRVKRWVLCSTLDI